MSGFHIAEKLNLKIASLLLLSGGVGVAFATDGSKDGDPPDAVLTASTSKASNNVTSETNSAPANLGSSVTSQLPLDSDTGFFHKCSSSVKKMLKPINGSIYGACQLHNRVSFVGNALHRGFNPGLNLGLEAHGHASDWLGDFASGIRVNLGFDSTWWYEQTGGAPDIRFNFGGFLKEYFGVAGQLNLLSFRAPSSYWNPKLAQVNAVLPLSRNLGVKLYGHWENNSNSESWWRDIFVTLSIKLLPWLEVGGNFKPSEGMSKKLAKGFWQVNLSNLATAYRRREIFTFNRKAIERYMELKYISQFNHKLVNTIAES